MFPLGLEWARIARIVGFAAALFAAGELLLPDSGARRASSRAPRWCRLFWALLYVTGFFHAAELEQLRAIRARVAGRAQRAQGRRRRTSKPCAAARS